MLVSDKEMVWALLYGPYPMGPYQLHYHQDVQVQRPWDTISTAILKQEISLLRFTFVDVVELVAGVNDVYTTGKNMFLRFQALITCWNGKILAIGRLIAQEKTQWFLIDIFGNEL